MQPALATQPRPRRLALFGATGGTGRHLLEQALAAGWEVTVLARDPSRLDLSHPALTVETGDVLDAEAVRRVVDGAELVGSCLGAPPSSKARIRERGTRVLVDVMEDLGVERLVSLSSHGVGDSQAELPWFMRWLVLPLYLRGVFDDHAAQEEVVRASSLCWTLVRPPHLTDAPGTGAPRHGTELIPSGRTMKIPRADVAAFMLQALSEESYVRQTPVITA